MFLFIDLILPSLIINKTAAAEPFCRHRAIIGFKGVGFRVAGCQIVGLRLVSIWVDLYRCLGSRIFMLVMWGKKSYRSTVLFPYEDLDTLPSPA